MAWVWRFWQHTVLCLPLALSFPWLLFLKGTVSSSYFISFLCFHKRLFWMIEIYASSDQRHLLCSWFGVQEYETKTYVEGALHVIPVWPMWVRVQFIFVPCNLYSLHNQYSRIYSFIFGNNLHKNISSIFLNFVFHTC